MLASSVEDVSQLKFPLLASTKLDGIRCLVKDGVALSRTLKPIRNREVQAFVSAHPDLNGCDGELMCSGGFDNVQSVFMSENGHSDDWYLAVFDEWENPARSFTDRLLSASLKVSIARDPRVTILEQVEIKSPKDLEGYERTVVSMGFEGVILRDAQGFYKYGRSTVREQKLLKLKRFQDGEARILGFVELQHNDNDATRDLRGLTKRSHAKAGLRAGGTLGALVVKDIVSGVEFEIGSGFTEHMRARIWEQQFYFRDKLVKYKRFEHGAKDKPRHPVFLGFRDAEDM